MMVTNIANGRTTITATVAGVGPDDTREDLLDLVLATTGETRGSIFGHSISGPVEPEGTPTYSVQLWTD